MSGSGGFKIESLACPPPIFKNLKTLSPTSTPFSTPLWSPIQSTYPLLFFKKDQDQEQKAPLNNMKEFMCFYLYLSSPFLVFWGRDRLGSSAEIIIIIMMMMEMKGTWL